MCPLLVQSVFLCDKTLNVIEDRLVFDLILHENLLARGCDRIGQAFMLRPPETAVNRCSGQHVFRGAWRVTLVVCLALTGIGSMRRGIQCWKSWSRKPERRRKVCGPIRSRCRRGSGGNSTNSLSRYPIRLP
jgi:hypothetical protein